MTAPAERQFPADDVLISRGKYSTLGAEKRTHLRLLRDDCETLADCARHLLNGAQAIGTTAQPGEAVIGLPFAQAKMAIAEERLRAAKIRLGELARLEPLMAELKKTAWGREKVEAE